jgi:hypothetical protein
MSSNRLLPTIYAPSNGWANWIVGSGGVAPSAPTPGQSAAYGDHLVSHPVKLAQGSDWFKASGQAQASVSVGLENAVSYGAQQ